MDMPPNVTMRTDLLGKVVKSLRELSGQQVLVGIPESKAERDNEDGGDINNATIGYINEFGSPAQNIPARPFLIPGVTKAHEPITKQLQAAATAALDGNTAQMTQALNAAGIEAANSAKDEMQTAPYEPLKPATIAARARQRGAKTRRKAEIEYLENVRNGMAPGDAQTAAGIRPLNNTGQLRNSITYVVTKGKH